MGFTKPDFPAVEPSVFLRLPLMERMKVLALSWVEHGFGAPRHNPAAALAAGPVHLR